MNIKKGMLILLGFLFSGLCAADDIDIFYSEAVVNDNADAQPNVLFVLDSSGSMADEVETYTPYDPSIDYGDSPDDRIYVYELDYDYTGIYIENSRNNCRAMQDGITDGNGEPTYIGKAVEWHESFFVFWDTSSWDDVSNSSRIVECEEDSGNHGADSDSDATYAADGRHGPYSTSRGREIRWRRVDQQMFVSANYHDYLINGGREERRKVDIMKEAATDLVNSFSGLNMGLMRFDGESGGYAIQHFSDIGSSRPEIIDAINSIEPEDWTPLAETLWEAMLYYRGDEVHYGTNWRRDPDAVSGSSYNSPIANACQKNFVVYLTDGNPYRDSGRDNSIRDLTGATQATCDHRDNASEANDTCLDELAGHMANNDMAADIEGVQDVRTYTIGFNIDMPLLEETAKKGKGKYYTANDTNELKSAFNQIIADILKESVAFIAPAVSVNAFNQLQHNNEIYYAIFSPQLTPRWYGNVKKYKINSAGEITDADGDIAVDDSTGYFLDTARSFWSSVPDGQDVRAGGAASHLDASRTVYTVTSNNPNPRDIRLSLPGNTIGISNGAITRAMLGLNSDVDNDTRSRLIEWILGYDREDDGPHRFFADPLHTRPVVVTYGGHPDDPDNPPDDTVYIMTNDGTFRAIDASSGDELFAFIPRELLPNQLLYFANDPDGNKVYGLDGSMTAWRRESGDPDRDIEPADGDHVYLYFGMRRGGRNLYGLDVTDRDNPVLKWVVYGGSDGFENLGETWSAPQRSKVRWDCDVVNEVTECEERDVLFFGGGYDVVHDNAEDLTTGDLGSAIYMVDAHTGELLWSAGDGPTDYDLDLPLKNSIPGDLAVNDIQNDGFVDSVMAVDIAGKVWRIDINKQPGDADEFATGGLIANLTDPRLEDGDPNTEGVFRRFYIGPSVALAKQPGVDPFFVVALGTGYVAQPKDETVMYDRHYGLFVDNIFEPLKDQDGVPIYEAVDNLDLYDVTDPQDDPADPDDGPADKSNNAPHGYFYNLTTPGEKIVRPITIRFGVTNFTSYVPANDVDPDELVCGVGHLGNSRAYARSFTSGESRFDDEYVELKQPGIAPESSVIYTDDSTAEVKKTSTTVCYGTECYGKDDPENPFPDSVPIFKAYWREN
jgi:type IV pilus assembly protein PilY1